MIYKIHHMSQIQWNVTQTVSQIHETDSSKLTFNVHT